MPFVPYHDLFPDIAERETRVVTLLQRAGSLPEAAYAFTELFCNERGCDCRRVFFAVFSSRTEQVEAVIAYGWETATFYKNWFPGATRRDIAELQGPGLNPTSPQSKLAPDILALFRKALLPDQRFIDRVKEHYRTVRSSIDKKKVKMSKGARTPPGGKK